ncbi:MAG: amidohydrolase family protein [Synergistaceae bacterium]|jgi:predicted TIM-barrel fold metal-dependent hydrolase|nr:amidohydrolase family protein [Synergistaceae bacterium]
MKKIDAHAHVGYFGSWCDVGVTAAEMVAAMRQYDIEKSIISYPDNSVTLVALAEHPTRFCGLAWMDPNKGEQTVADFTALVNRDNREGGLSGLKLHPLFNAYTANDPVVFPLIEAARKKDLPVFIHSGHPPFSLPWSIGQLAELYPDVRIVMIHMGHGHGVYIQAAIDVAAKYDNIWLENSGMPMHTKIREAYNRVGSERLFWGSDAPFHHYAVEILRTEVSGLSEPQLEDVFYKNIKKFMGW